MAFALPLVDGAVGNISPEELREWVDRAIETERTWKTKLKESFGLNEGEQGDLLLLALLAEFYYIDVRPTLKKLDTALLAYTGTMEAIYSWAGGVGSAVEAGLSAVAKDVETAVEDIEHFF